ncbi:MAG TPA: ATP-binding protein [Gammaproteobacteria bacterium]|nr:ATP-binding protein [Gammaproteobacteria bacterium]
MQSLRARVLLWVSVALIVLFAITIVGLAVIFQRSSELALRDALQVQLLGLIAAAEESEDGELSLPDDPGLDLSLTVPESGVYGVIWDADGVPIWRSASWVGREWFVTQWPIPGERIYLTIDEGGLLELEALLMGIRWDFHDGSSLPYTFGIALAREPYLAREAAFRRNLIGWFAVVTVTMLIVLTIVLRYALKPLRRLVHEVGEIETGRRQVVTERLPSELTGLARNLNFLIDSERRRSIRYRNTLDDLAHSLKTPLASIRALLTDRGVDDEAKMRALDREVSRMDQRIGYQLRRARATGGTGLGLAPVALGPIVEDIVDTLDKVYRDKQVSCEFDIEAGARYQGDPGDLNEILGNLIDNAYKYCRKRVLVEVKSSVERVEIVIHDDGPGLPEDAEEAVIERGARADESIPGEGIGLAVVAETAELYQGSVRLGTSPLGGTAVRVILPRRGYRLEKKS